MTDHSSQPALLDELDARQDEVLRQLDELNARLEKLLSEQTVSLRLAADGDGEVADAA